MVAMVSFRGRLNGFLLDAVHDPKPARRVDRVAHAVLGQAEEDVLGRRLQQPRGMRPALSCEPLSPLRTAALKSVFASAASCLASSSAASRVRARRRRALRALVLHQDDAEDDRLRRVRGEAGGARP